MIRTIRRNSAETREMWEQATRAVSYTLENYFRGHDVSIHGARNWFERVSPTLRPRITCEGRTYTIHYDSNHWTELLIDNQEEE